MKAGTFFLALALCVVCAQAQREVTLLPTEKEIPEISTILKTRYAVAVGIPAGKVNRADFGKFLESLNGGAVLMEQPGAVRPVRPISTDFLPYKIGYWRLSSFTPQRDWKSLADQLGAWQRAGAIGIVLDARNNTGEEDFSAAAMAASYFTAPGSTLFILQGMQTPQEVFVNREASRVWNLPIVVLVNHRTAGAAEAFAASLRSLSGAIVLGQSTLGRAGVLMDVPLKSGRYLQIATSQARLADGTALFGHPVAPDIDVFIDAATESKVMEKIDQGVVVALLAERAARPHLTEASLVNNENPELEEAAANASGRGEKAGGGEGHPQDTALMRACDALRAIDLKRRKGAEQASATGLARKEKLANR
jgi:hypothetical protein